MRDLAEFIMRGRWQALAVAVIGSVLVIAAPVSAAAIALVTLGRSVRDVLGLYCGRCFPPCYWAG